VQNIYTFFYHRWVKDLFRKGYGKNLDVEDLYDTLPSDRSEMLGDELEK
jgi:hypothetical protein